MRAIQKWVIEDLTEHFASSDYSQLPSSYSSIDNLQTLLHSDSDFKSALDRVQSAQIMAKILTDLGIEVDAVEGIPKQVFSTVGRKSSAFLVIGYVEEVQPHPDAKKLQVATVFDGKKHYQVVCGASNCRKGMYVVFAKEGAEIIPYNKGEDHKIVIEGVQLRGVHSQGMLCAMEEIGFAPEGEGIIDLHEDFLEAEMFWKERLGSPALSLLLNLQTRPCFELGLTPNLAHCFSARGVAREFCAAAGLSFFKNPKSLLKDPEATKKDQSTCTRCSRYCALKVHNLPNSCCHLQGFEAKLDAPHIQIEKDAHCYSYNGVVLEGINYENFDQDVAKRRASLLKDAGERSVDPLVDITNELMFDKGHPVHVFDLEKIKGPVIVRLAKAGEKAITLDGVERTLTSSMTVIADSEKVLAIAGVMGCQSSSVDHNTKKVLLEVANFLPSSVRKTSRELALSTGSSKRFERGIDNRDCTEVTHAFISRVLQLQRPQNSVVVSEIFRAESKTLVWKPMQPVLLPLAMIEDVLGFPISLPSFKEKLQQIGVTVVEKGDAIWECTPPSWRHDLSIAEDYIEEALKLHGIDHVPSSSRPSFSDSCSVHDPIWSLERLVRHRFAAMGLTEIITPDLVDWDFQQSLGYQKEQLAKVLNPSNEQMNSCRFSLLPGALVQVKQFQSRGENFYQFFEIGSVYEASGDDFKEKRVLLIALSKQRAPDWRKPQQLENDFFDLKHLLTTCFSSLGAVETKSLNEGAELDLFHPGQRAQLVISDKATNIGVMGQVHPEVRKKMQLNSGVFFAQIDLEKLPALVPSLVKKEVSTSQTLWRGEDYPCMIRDLTIDAPKEKTIEELLHGFSRAKIQLESQQEWSERIQILRNIELLSVFEPKEESAVKRVTFRFIYRHKDRTLTQEEVDALHSKIIACE